MSNRVFPLCTLSSFNDQSLSNSVQVIDNKTVSGSVFAVQVCPPAALPHPLVLLHSGEDRIRRHPKPKLKQNTKNNGKTSPEEQPASPSVTPSPAEAPPSPEKKLLLFLLERRITTSLK